MTAPLGVGSSVAGAVDHTKGGDMHRITLKGRALVALATTLGVALLALVQPLVAFASNGGGGAP